MTITRVTEQAGGDEFFCERIASPLGPNVGGLSNGVDRAGHALKSQKRARPAGEKGRRSLGVSIHQRVIMAHQDWAARPHRLEDNPLYGTSWTNEALALLIIELE